MDSVSRKILVNGQELLLVAPPQARLLDVLREEIRLTGTKEGCGEGECGACSVLLNDQVVNACLVLFGQLLDGDRLVTVEGLSNEHHLSPLQDCFIAKVGTQCGMCTPGMLISAHALLMKNSSPTREEIAVALAGNLCRCTGYVKIIDAVERAAKILRGEGGDV